MLAFILTALLVGIVVVFFLPFVQEQVSKSPQLSAWMTNRFVQILVVGAIVLVGLMIFVALARSLKIPVAVKG
jgi:flagellar biosynthesis/type III secretory pathway M-ring protein FliF/YscJ